MEITKDPTQTWHVRNRLGFQASINRCQFDTPKPVLREVINKKNRTRSRVFHGRGQRIIDLKIPDWVPRFRLYLPLDLDQVLKKKAFEFVFFVSFNFQLKKNRNSFYLTKKMIYSKALRLVLPVGILNNCPMKGICFLGYLRRIGLYNQPTINPPSYLVGTTIFPSKQSAFLESMDFPVKPGFGWDCLGKPEIFFGIATCCWEPRSDFYKLGPNFGAFFPPDRFFFLNPVPNQGLFFSGANLLWKTSGG